MTDGAMTDAMTDGETDGAEAVLAELRRRRAGDLPTHGGHTLAYVFDSGLAGVDDLAAQAHALASAVNGLDPTAFPSLLQCENELVGAAAALLGGGAATVGTVTSGGTESCLLAVLGARDARPEVARPRWCCRPRRTRRSPRPRTTSGWKRSACRSTRPRWPPTRPR
jgi:glutamate/tyrosine decarboxylase-like PLP-dependent enzyme